MVIEILLILQNKCQRLSNFTNKTKGGVDTTDQLCATYNVARNARRLPLVIFFSLVNLASINARIILLLTENPPLVYKKRSLFIKHLAFALMQPQIDRRSCSNMNSRLKLSWHKFTTKRPTDDQPEQCASSLNQSEGFQPLEKRRKSVIKSRCQICSYKTDHKTRTTCSKCNKYICGSHVVIICVNCNEPKNLMHPEISDSDDEM